MKIKLSGIILTKNEQQRIEKAIASLSFCDEIIVVDDESIDATRDIAEQGGARVLLHPKNSEFSGQRNWAMEQAKNDWIIFVDADEVVSEELKKEIIDLFSANDQRLMTNYSIPRRDFFWGKELRYGETHGARTQGIIRLIQKGSGVWTGAVHERFIASGNTGSLKNYLDHNSHETLAEFIQDINTYSSIRADELHQQGIQYSTGDVVVTPLAKFIYTYFILRGFLDGPAGFVYSFVMSFHSFLVRAKMLTKYD